MQVTGSCFCKAIQYEASIDPALVGLCHCRDCQIFSGSAFRMATAVSPADFTFTRGEPRYFAKTADSGKVRRMAFCDQCGTHICSVPSEEEMNGGFVSLRLATSDQFERVKPTLELYAASRVSWLAPLQGCLEFQGMPE